MPSRHLEVIRSVFARLLLAALIILVFAGVSPANAGPAGYYRHPALHDGTVVFVAEGDLWKAPIDGGVASRLTSHPGMEMHPVLSPDGTTVAFTAQYEGPVEIYTMPPAAVFPCAAPSTARDACRPVSLPMEGLPSSRASTEGSRRLPSVPDRSEGRGARAAAAFAGRRDRVER